MKRYTLIISIVFIALIGILGYLTHIYKSTGVPFYRHNDVYEIVQTDTIIKGNGLDKNYTEPYKKYSIIGVDELEIDDYKDSIVFSKEEKRAILLPKDENP
jgi:hypothetical protein